MVKYGKKSCSEQRISKLLILALIASLALLMALPCGAKTSCGQLDLNQLMNATSSTNGLAGHSTLFYCPVFTDITDDEQAAVSDNQTENNIQGNAQSTQSSACDQSNRKCPITSDNSTSCSPTPSPIVTPTPTPSPTTTPVDDNTYIPTDSEGLWPYLTPAQQAECLEFDKHNMFPTMIGHNRVADYVVWKKENMAIDMFRDMYGLPIDGNTARYYAKMVDNKKINDAGAWDVVKNAMIKDKDSMETCYYNGEPIHMRNNNIF